MALIGKIRKNYWLVLVLIFLALAAFIIMDATSAGGMGGAQASMDMGEVNGNKINYRDFERAERVYYGNQGDAFQTRDNIWNYFVEKSIIDSESKAAGLHVGKDELMDLQFGANMSPIMAQNWRNPQTGAIDRNQLSTIKSQIEGGTELDENFRSFWAEQENQIIKAQKQDKLNNLVSKSIYTPSWLAQKAYKEQNDMVDFEYVKIPFDNISNDQVSLTDDDYKAYLAANKDAYTNKVQSRTIEYVVFDINATDDDIAALRNEMVQMKAEFETTDNDSLFAARNQGYYNDFYFSKDRLTNETTDSIAKYLQIMNVGEVVGPIEEQGLFRNIKLLDKRVIPDSVNARHILRNVTVGDANSLANARSMIDSLRGLIERRVERFDSLAVKFSQDTGSGANGGDLGYFVQETMVPEFKAASFYDGKEGGLYTVETQYGVHLIEVLDQKYLNRDPKYKFAFVNKPIIPSTATQDRVNEEVADLVASHPYLDDMVNVINERSDVSFDRISNIKANDYVLGDLGGGSTSRQIVRWAFEPGTDENDIAPDVFIYTDPNLYYANKNVIAGLKSIEPAGLRSVASVGDEIMPLIQNEKKADIIMSRLTDKDISSSATEFGATVESATGVSFNSRFIPNLGNEPGVIAQAFNTDTNASSKAIIGNSGVYVVRPTNKVEAGEAINLPSFRSSDANTSRNKVSLSLIQALKNVADVSDSRYTFF